MAQEYVLIEKAELASIADKVRNISGSSTAMNVLDIDANLGDEVAAVKENLATWLVENGTTIEELANLKEIADTIANTKNLDTSDATAVSSDILSGKTAYVDGEKITGNIPTKSSGNLTANGATVTVPSGYYASQATKSVSTGSAKTPATTITKNPSISVDSAGKITASVSGTQSVTPTVTAGYVSSGTAGTITISGSATKQLTTQAAKTVTPTKSSQTAVASGVYTTGAVTVAAIPSEYITTTDATAVASEVLNGKTAYVKGSKVTGTMANNGTISATMDGLDTKSVTIPSGYTSGGTVSLDNTINTAVTNAIAALTEKGVEVPNGTNVTDLAELIASIEAGGSFDPSPFSQILTGTFTPASMTRVFTIPEEAVGKVGFLFIYKCVSDNSALTIVQCAYNNLGYLFGGATALYNYIMNEDGVTKIDYPTISEDGRTFTNVKNYNYSSSTTYAYIIGMVSE